MVHVDSIIRGKDQITFVDTARYNAFQPVYKTMWRWPCRGNNLTVRYNTTSL